MGDIVESLMERLHHTSTGDIIFPLGRLGNHKGKKRKSKKRTYLHVIPRR